MERAWKTLVNRARREATVPADQRELQGAGGLPVRFVGQFFAISILDLKLLIEYVILPIRNNSKSKKE